MTPVAATAATVTLASPRFATGTAAPSISACLTRSGSFLRVLTSLFQCAPDFEKAFTTMTPATISPDAGDRDPVEALLEDNDADDGSSG